MKSWHAQASPHSKCDKTIRGKVLIAAPAPRPIGKLKLIQFLPALCPKAHPSQSPQMFSSAEEKAPRACSHLTTLEGRFFYGAGTNNWVLPKRTEILPESEIEIKLFSKSPLHN